MWKSGICISIPPLWNCDLHKFAVPSRPSHRSQIMKDWIWIMISSIQERGKLSFTLLSSPLLALKCMWEALFDRPSSSLKLFCTLFSRTQQPDEMPPPLRKFSSDSDSHLLCCKASSAHKTSYNTGKLSQSPHPPRWSKRHHICTIDFSSANKSHNDQTLVSQNEWPPPKSRIPWIYPIHPPQKQIFCFQICFWR